jgi:NitT/TauT family transport system ATP-binding protein
LSSSTSTDPAADPLAHAAPPKLVVDRVNKAFESRAGLVIALLDIDLRVAEGEFLCIVGPSGCGKTTLLRIIAGLEDVTTGRVEVVRDDPSRPTNTMVFQEQSVFPWMTVRDNIAYGLLARGISASKRHEVADHYVQKLGLGGFAKAFPHQLSGGMKQRVSIARAFANDPEILLMDEPFANLDEQTKLLMQDQLLQTWQETHKTVVFITHSIEEAVALGDRVIVLTARPGRIRAEFRVDLPRPRSVLLLKGTPRFAELTAQIWDILRDEVLAAQRTSEGQRGDGEA